jgi:benzylsuccinate CoA-transferase BbsE subunit
MTSEPEQALSGLRVLDLTSEIGTYCGKLFADLGAEVILVEHPDGDPQRSRPPRASAPLRKDLSSLSFLYMSANKRSIGLDVTKSRGREIFLDLVRTADIVLEDHKPGELDSLRLGFKDLRKANPLVVLVSMTAFGQRGPRAEDEYSDLTCLASGGLLWMGGYPDTEPMQAAAEQAYLAASAYGALAGLAPLALGEPVEATHVDVSAQECVVMALENAAQYFDLEGTVRGRSGGEQRRAGAGVFPCSDGYVMLLAGGVGGNRFWGGLVKWLRSEGVAEVDQLEDGRWGDAGFLETGRARDVFWKIFVSFSLARTKAEVYQGAQRHRVPCTPVNGPEEVFSDPQLTSRGYFQDISIEGNTIRVPGPPYQLSLTPWSQSRQPPAAGEATKQLLSDLGFSKGTLLELTEDGVIL